jgi:signal peptidase II
MPLIIVHHQLKKLALLLFFSIISTIKYALIDQLSKWWVKSILLTKPGYVISITSFLDLVYSWNHGISFGMFQEYQSTSNKVFLILNAAIILYIWRLLLKVENYKIYIGYSLIIGGAVGNIYDRLAHGAVFDFIYFHYKNFYFPAFNLADSFICIGALIVAIEYYKITKAVAKKKEAEYDAESVEADRIRKLDAEIAERGIK